MLSSGVAAFAACRNAVRREEVKDAKYLYLCRLRDFLFVPFVVETGGRLGERAIEFMRVVADHAVERMRLRRRLTHRDVRRISATLYRRGTQAVSVARVCSVTGLEILRFVGKLRFSSK